MKAKELAEELLIKKAKIKQGDKEREIVLKDRMHIFEGMKAAFNIKDDDEISEEKFKEMMDAFLNSKSHEIPIVKSPKKGGNK